jgi:hypothetical protein
LLFDVCDHAVQLFKAVWEAVSELDAGVLVVSEEMGKS